MQPPRGITNAACIHRHVDNLSLDGRRWTGIGIGQEKRAPTLRACATPITLLVFSHGAIFDNIAPLAVWAVQCLGDHYGSLSQACFCVAQIPRQDSRSTALKHLPGAH
jgi:hypothetical protein